MSDDTVHKVHEGVICWRPRNCHLGLALDWWEGGGGRFSTINPLIVNTEYAIV